MPPRRTILELFTTFVQFTQEQFSGWAIDARLRRSMANALKASTLEDESVLHQSEQFWVTYWHQQWQSVYQAEVVSRQTQLTEQSPCGSGTHGDNTRLPLNHLAAYLQETCYWIAQRSTTLTSQHLNLADYFQIAIASLPKIIQGYTPEYGASLKTYAGLCFNNAIRDGLRRHKEADSRSNWGLLRKISQKSFNEMLSQSGLNPETISSYQLAWSCFKLYCAPTQPTTTRQLSDPDRTTWQRVTDCYNQQRLKLAPSPAAATPPQLEQWLTQCANHARNYLHPSLSSLNVAIADSTDELQDQLAADSDLSPMTALLAQEALQERQQRHAQIAQMLTEAVSSLDPQGQKLLNLYYGQQLTQQQIAAHLEIKQYTVSRRLSSIKEKLLLAIAQWSQNTLHISPTSTAVKGMSVLLEEWLEAHYRAANGSPKEASQ
jgi:RNA polymerase sigma factor (sigma-70 family)